MFLLLLLPVVALWCVGHLLAAMPHLVQAQPLGATPATVATELPVSAWAVDCQNSQMYIEGRGLGDLNDVTQQKHMALTETLAVRAQVAGKLDAQTAVPAQITFTTDVQPPLIVTQTYSVTDKGYFFAAHLPQTSGVTLTLAPLPPDLLNSTRGWVVYSLREDRQNDWSSYGRMTNQYVHGDSHSSHSVQEVITFAPLLEATSLTVTAVVIDNQKIDNQKTDSRGMIVAAQAGGQLAQTEIITQPDKPLINIVTLQLQDVPTNTTQLTVTLTSPQKPSGDSLILSGVNVSFRCQTARQFHTYIPAVARPIPFSLTAVPTKAYVGLPVIVEAVLQNESQAPYPPIVLEPTWSAGLVPHPLLPSTLTCTDGRNTVQCDLTRLRPSQIHPPIKLPFLPLTSGRQLVAGALLRKDGALGAVGQDSIEIFVNRCINDATNISTTMAFGPLLTDIDYCADLDPTKPDYYYIDVAAPVTVTVLITNPNTTSSAVANQILKIVGSNNKLLRTATDEAKCCQWRNRHNKVEWPLLPGRYYIVVEARDYALGGRPYTLTLTLSP